MNGTRDTLVGGAIAAFVTLVGGLGPAFWTLVALGVLEIVAATLADWRIGQPRVERARAQAARVVATWLMVPFAHLLQPYAPVGVDLQTLAVIPLIWIEAKLVAGELHRAGVALPEWVQNLVASRTERP